MFAALRRGAGLCGLLLAEAAALVTLIQVGRRPAFAVPWHRLGEWLDTAPPGDVLVALLRGIALAGVGWVSLTTVLYTLAAATRVPAATRALRWSTVPGVRRVIDAVFVASMASVTVAAPLGTTARAANAPAVSVSVRDGRRANVPEAPAPPLAPPALPAPPAPPARSATAAIVAPGDSLWELAAETVAAATGRTRAQVPDSEVAPYWARVCDANAAHVPSGDVDLIHPGERVELPPYP